jgi:hypothetical protein
VNLLQKRRRRVEIIIDNRMLGFLKPVPLNGSLAARRKRDSLEFLLPPSVTPPTPPPTGDLHDQAS